MATKLVKEVVRETQTVVDGRVVMLALNADGKSVTFWPKGTQKKKVVDIEALYRCCESEGQVLERVKKERKPRKLVSDKLDNQLPDLEKQEEAEDLTPDLKFDVDNHLRRAFP